MTAKAIIETRQPFLWATYPSRLHFRELVRATLSRRALAHRETGSTWSCTKRGFSCPDITRGYIGIAYATIVITDNAVVSYTTFSPFSRFLHPKKPGCVFSVILSVSAGCRLQNPRFLRQGGINRRQTREAPCPVVFGLSSQFHQR